MAIVAASKANGTTATNTATLPISAIKGGDTVELKPCPWCGGGITIIYRSASNMFHVYHCNDSGKCDIIGPFKIHKSRAATLEEAAEVWNRRVNDGAD
jgi:hypothetical protein